MSDRVKVRALRRFEGEEGLVGPKSDPFFVTKQRFAELKANELVEALNEEPAPTPSPDEEPARESAGGRGRRRS